MPTCIGRRYPQNSPLTIGGCLERPPPLIFRVLVGGLTGTWAQYDNVPQFLPYDMIGTGTQGPFDQFSQWRLTVVAGKVWVIRTMLDAGVWKLRLTLTQGFPGGGLGVSTWEKDFAAGFPKWVTMAVPLVNQTPLWTFGGFTFALVEPAGYSTLPAGFCT